MLAVGQAAEWAARVSGMGGQFTATERSKAKADEARPNQRSNAKADEAQSQGQRSKAKANEKRKSKPVRDSNPQPSGPKPDTLSIAPTGPHCRNVLPLHWRLCARPSRTRLDGHHRPQHVFAAAACVHHHCLCLCCCPWVGVGAVAAGIVVRVSVLVPTPAPRSVQRPCSLRVSTADAWTTAEAQATDS